MLYFVVILARSRRWTEGGVRIKRSLLVLGTWVSLAEAAQAQPGVQWELLNRMRLLGRGDISADKTLPPSLAGQTGRAFYLAATRRLVLPQEEEDAAFQARITGREAFIEAPISVRLTAVVSSTAGVCNWRFDGEEKSLPCDQDVVFERRFSLFSPAKWEGRLQTEKGETSFEVTPTVHIIAGLGDSFGSGEGNPDAVASFERLPAGKTTGDWFSRPEFAKRIRPSRWTDTGCHRSALNNQVLAAAAYAAAHPQHLTAMIHLACSGASVFDGLMVPQEGLPGSSDKAPTSQLQQLADILCESREEPVAVALPSPFGWRAGARKRRLETTQLTACPADSRLKLDQVLISIGGNDIGFAGVIAWAVLPNGYNKPLSDIGLQFVAKVGGVVCPARTREKRCLRGTTANAHITDRHTGLSALYKAVQTALDGLGVKPDQVIQTGYPNPLHSAYFQPGQHLKDGVHCPLMRNEEARLTGQPLNLVDNLLVSPGNEAVLSQVSPKQFGTFGKVLGLVSNDRRLQSGFQITTAASEAALIDLMVVGPLNKTIEAKPAGWRRADVADLAEGRGWCAVDNPPPLVTRPRIASAQAELTELRSVWRTQGNRDTFQLTAEMPAAFDPYAPRRRLFRTPNDSVLTQWHGPGYALTGMYHPTAELHALMGEVIAAEMAVAPRPRH